MTTDSYTYTYTGLTDNSTTQLDAFFQQDWYMAAYSLGIVYPWVVCGLGLPCNIANVIIIWRKWVMSPPKLYIAVLSVVDCLAVSHKLLMVHLPTLGVSMTPGACRYLEFVNQTSSQLSSWTLVLLSAERAMVIKFPFSRQTICSIRRTLITLVATTIILAMLNSHWLFTVTSFQARRECTQHPDFRQFITDIWYYVEAAFYAFLPFLCLIISNSIIIVCLSSRIKRERARCYHSRPIHNGCPRRHLRSGRSTNRTCDSLISSDTSNNHSVSPRTSQSSRTGALMWQQYRKITRTTLLASFVFFLLTVPYCVTMLSIKHIHVTPLSVAHAKIVFITTLVYALRDMSHAINFFVYALPTSTLMKCRVLISRSRRKRSSNPVTTSSFRLVSGKESFIMREQNVTHTCEPSNL